MSRLVSLIAIAAVLTVSPAFAADWGGEGKWVDVGYTQACGDGGFRGSLEPKDWSGLGDECDPLSFEFGTRYWYSWGAHGMTVIGDSYSSNDTSHILEGHLRITDHSSDVYVKALGGYSAVINSNFSTPTDPAGSSQAGRVLYLGADIGYAPLFAEGHSGFGGFIGYQYWNDSPDMGQFNFAPGAGPNDINYHLFKLGLAGRLDFGMGDITAEVAAIPYAPVWGNYGAFDGSAAPGDQTSIGTLGGWLYGATAEVMGRFHPTENWTVGLGGRAWYLTGQADVRFSTDDAGGTNWVTKTTNFSTLRYGLLGEVSYRF
jgi:hypothetical protein